MVIHDLDLFRTIRSSRPLEADSPLLVYSYAVLAFPIARKRLEMVAVELGQIV